MKIKGLVSIQAAAKKVVKLNRLMGDNNIKFLDDDSSVIDEEESCSSQVYDLNKICAEARPDGEDIWGEILGWLKRHSPEKIKEAVLYQGDADMTAIHFICRVNPPPEIVRIMCDNGEEALEYPDSFGWVPIHYACACNASDEAIEVLMEAGPMGKTIVDRAGRAPLHFALHNKKPLSSEMVAKLASTGAATYPDNQGKLPLHYACEYVCDHSIVRTLVEMYPDGLVALDEKGRSALLYCLTNCHTNHGAESVEYMLERKHDLVNRYKGDAVPLHSLADQAHHIEFNDMEGQANATKCLELYMNSEPNPTADLISSIQQLPEWLLEEAVGLPIVQTLLNQKIIQPFPTAVLMMDFYVICMMVINFSTLILKSIQLRADDDPDNDALGSRVVPLYLGSSYFFLRESTQFIGQASLGAFSTYMTDATNLLDIIYISLVVYWAVLMQTGTGDDRIFQTGTALTIGLVWINVMVYLKNIIIDLAIFVAGVKYVLKRLYAFMLATTIILTAFAQVFMTLRQQSGYCDSNEIEKSVNEIRCNTDTDKPFCAFWTSIIRVINMMLGGVDDKEFADTRVGLFFFILFFFMGVVLLANVLIAIVTDSYGVVRDERAGIVFWFNRLDFVAEMDAIAHGPWNRKLRRFFGFSVGSDEDEQFLQTANKSTFGSGTWTTLMNLFEDELDDVGWFSLLSLNLMLNRCIVAFIVLPIWLFLGLATIGTLWPPQVRQYVLIDAVATKLENGDSGEEDEEVRNMHVETIVEYLEEMRTEITNDLIEDQKTLQNIEDEIYGMKHEISHEIRDISNYMQQVIEAHNRGDEELPPVPERRTHEIPEGITYRDFDMKEKAEAENEAMLSPRNIHSRRRVYSQRSLESRKSNVSHQTPTRQSGSGSNGGPHSNSYNFSDRQSRSQRSSENRSAESQRQHSNQDFLSSVQGGSARGSEIDPGAPSSRSLQQSLLSSSDSSPEEFLDEEVEEVPSGGFSFRSRSSQSSQRSGGGLRRRF